MSMRICNVGSTLRVVKLCMVIDLRKNMHSLLVFSIMYKQHGDHAKCFFILEFDNDK